MSEDNHKSPWWAHVLIVILSPVLYFLTHRKNGRSWQDYWQFLIGK